MWNLPKPSWHIQYHFQRFLAFQNINFPNFSASEIGRILYTQKWTFVSQIQGPVTTSVAPIPIPLHSVSQFTSHIYSKSWALKAQFLSLIKIVHFSLNVPSFYENTFFITQFWKIAPLWVKYRLTLLTIKNPLKISQL